MVVDIKKLQQLYKFSKHLSLSDASELIKAAKTKTYQKKELIMSEGSLSNNVVFVREGLIRQYLLDKNGEERTFRLIPENYLMANVDLVLFEQPSRFYFEAYEKTKVFMVDYNVVMNIVQNNPKLQKNHTMFSRRMMKEMHKRLELFVLSSAEERYLSFLEDYPHVANRVPDKYIASVLGMTPVTLSRIRAKIASEQ
ncbi:MAG: Crp/Fnr family transcriptional regulator [bacterium]|nr:Crp/Fnr family transcriptional regulator [bacterium]